jgi:pimeloyl-ACP methyl ester carboxylesterase
MSTHSEARTFLLIHGGWAGGWIWERIVPLLERAGHRAIAPDLPGRGVNRTPLAEITLETYANSVVELLEKQPEPVILVGHSSSGIVISQAAERVPNQVAQLIYVCAYLPQDGDSLMSLGQSDPEQILLPNLVPSADGKTVSIRPEVVREALFADCSDDVYTRAIARFSPGEPIAFATTPVRLSSDAFGRIPKRYIECRNDRAISPVLQRRMHARVTGTTVVTMDTGHSPFYAAPEILAQHLLSTN